MILLQTTRTKNGKHFHPFTKFACGKTTNTQCFNIEFIKITFELCNLTSWKTFTIKNEYMRLLGVMF